MVLLFDIGCVSSTPTEILRKGRSRYPVLSEFRKGLTDVAFSSDDKSWYVTKFVLFTLGMPIMFASFK
jgi:hypothetical protein